VFCYKKKEEDNENTDDHSGFVVCFFCSSILYGSICGRYPEGHAFKKYKEEKDICPVVKKSITEGINTQDVTRACIETGHDACLVIRCAIEAKGNLEQIITGALEAGTTSDVCSRCAVDAGVKAGNIAKILETGLGYSPAFGAGLTPVEIGIPGGSNKGSVLSRSSF
jgi:hypothetical protein